MVDAELLKEIDNAHRIANEALKNKRQDVYIDSFDNELQYKQLNGKTIGKEELANDLARYFNRIRTFSSSFERKTITFSEDRVIEKLVQHATVSIRVFIFFSKNWSIERVGIYEWVKVDKTWKICNVEILAEKVL